MRSLAPPPRPSHCCRRKPLTPLQSYKRSLDRVSLLRAEQVTILLVDQMAGLALSLADRGYVIEGGRISASGSAAEIAADGALEKAYLGAQ